MSVWGSYLQLATQEIILTEEFLELTEDLLCKILQSEKLEAQELDLFLATYSWGKHQQQKFKEAKSKKRASSSEGRSSGRASTPITSEQSSDQVVKSPEGGSPMPDLRGDARESVVAVVGSPSRKSAADSEEAEKRAAMRRDIKDLRWRMHRVLTYIRFPQIPARALMQIVYPTGVVPTKELFQAACFLADPNSIDISQRIESRWAPRPGKRSTLF